MLIPKDQFVGIENVAHLATGGESPMLKSHQQAIGRFFEHKAQGEMARHQLEATHQRTKEKTAQLFSVEPESITFLSSASDGINLLAHSIDWHPGDNVVVADVEFPSDVLPWTHFADQGVEIRIVRHRDWRIHLEDVQALIDDRTRVVAMSYVSYFTGQRQDLPALSKLVRQSNAIFLLDATHAAGVVPVEAHYADIMVSSCYKFLLGVHGTGIFYWNRERLPDLKPPFLGWNTGQSIPSWDAPTDYVLKANADRFQPGNPSFLSIYVLENALDHFLDIGLTQVEEHVLTLSGEVWGGLTDAGWSVMTPQHGLQRAGNICFEAPNIDDITKQMAQKGVLIWGSYGGVTRVRVSTHLFNDSQDVQRFLSGLAELVPIPQLS
ncbi:MAG: aminotransferase class V-fold PLP-dependent enzyme [Chloroflexota bacterium]